MQGTGRVQITMTEFLDMSRFLDFRFLRPPLQLLCSYLRKASSMSTWKNVLRNSFHNIHYFLQNFLAVSRSLLLNMNQFPVGSKAYFNTGTNQLLSQTNSRKNSHSAISSMRFNRLKLTDGANEATASPSFTLNSF